MEEDSVTGRFSQKSKNMPLYPIGMFNLIIYLHMHNCYYYSYYVEYFQEYWDLD